MEYLQHAEKALKTSFFKWSPDYISAAHYYQQAGEKFKREKEYHKAYKAFKNAALAHLRSKEEISASRSFESAAHSLLSSCSPTQFTDNDLKEYVSLIERAINIVSEQGDPQKTAKVYTEAAKNLEKIFVESASKVIEDTVLQYYIKAVCLLENADRAVFNVDLLPVALSFCIRVKEYTKAIQVINSSIKIYSSLNQTRRIHQLYLTLVILYLARNDSVAARNAFSSHFEDANYLKSREAEAAEDLLTSFESYDLQRINDSVNSYAINGLNRHVVMLARSFLSNDNARPDRVNQNPSTYPVLSTALKDKDLNIDQSKDDASAEVPRSGANEPVLSTNAVDEDLDFLR